MLFEVFGPDKLPRMGTNYVECIYDRQILKRMHESGFSFKLNGKRATIKDVVDYCTQNCPPAPKRRGRSPKNKDI